MSYNGIFCKIIGCTIKGFANLYGHSLCNKHFHEHLSKNTTEFELDDLLAIHLGTKGTNPNGRHWDTAVSYADIKEAHDKLRGKNTPLGIYDGIGSGEILDYKTGPKGQPDRFGREGYYEAPSKANPYGGMSEYNKMAPAGFDDVEDSAYYYKNGKKVFLTETKRFKKSRL